MSPALTPDGASNDDGPSHLNLSMVGIGVAYPPFRLTTDALKTLALRHYPGSTAMMKSLAINRCTGIDSRSAIGDVNHPIVNQSEPPTIRELNDLFMEEGVKLSVSACRQALSDWGGSAAQITHMVSTTCTASSNPGFDAIVAKKLGLARDVEKVLLHGVGCSGGMAAIRTAANIALGASYRQRPARVLILACEICSVMVRSELESIHRNQEVRIGIALFSDCASACILSNGRGQSSPERTIYELLGFRHEVLDNTDHDLGFDVDPVGWKVVLTPRVPIVTSAAVLPAFQALVASISDHAVSDHAISAEAQRSSPPMASDFDWALHPGGSSILTGVQKALNLTEDHLLASYKVYVQHGNSSSATILSVLDRSRKEQKRERVVACAFGPGICLEMMVARRGRGKAAGDENGLTAEDVD